MARLDFVLVSEDLSNFCFTENIEPGYRSDHSLVSITLKIHESVIGQRKKTLWKFNNSLIKNVDYNNKIRKTITQCKIEYAASPYRKDSIDIIPNSDLQTIINPQLFLEMILLQIRNETIKFSKSLKLDEDKTLYNLNIEIKELEERLINDPSVGDLLSDKKEEQQSLRSKKLEGILIRSRARWLQNGEKPTQYFCNLESRNFISKRMSSLILDTGEEIFNDELIKEEVGKFYENLYSSRENSIEDADLKSHEKLKDIKTLSEEESLSLEGELNHAEISNVIKNMKNNKSPGSDGFTVEFYKFFWKDIGHFILNAINYSYCVGTMSTTQREGIITCIPKSNKCKKYVKNWRPITLLNVTYKIASGAIANRLKRVLHSIINYNQCGFMSNRFTGDNIRLIYDVMNHAGIHGKKGLLMLIDFEKAFDSIAWSFLFKCLHFFNFKDSLIDWIKLFLRDIKGRVQVNGSFSGWFNVLRGCRQGDPISPYLFLICSEILAHMIRNDPEIKGYKINQFNLKVSQYADDTSIFLDGSESSFNECIDTLTKFGRMSGLNMNFEKTKMVWFGCPRPPETRYMEHMGFEWNPEIFTLLGVNFRTDLYNLTDLNIMSRMNDMKRELAQWSKRDLTPEGKITVIKSLILSKIVHLLIALPNPTKKMVQELKTMFFKFIWNNKPEKVKRIILQQKFGQGGLGMVDIDLFIQSLKLTWVKRLVSNNSIWKQFNVNAYPDLRHLVHYGPNYAYELLKQIKNPFWKDVFHCLIKYRNKIQIDTFSQFNSLSFLYNSEIQIDRKPISLEILSRNNIYLIDHLRDSPDRFLSFVQFVGKYNVPLNFLTFHSIIQAIKVYERKLNLVKNDRILKYEIQYPFYTVCKVLKGSRVHYDILTAKAAIPKGFTKWQGNLEQNTWETYFFKLKVSTTDMKLRWFQYRILHHILTTNRTISKYNPYQSPLCEFCKIFDERIEHVLWHCRVVQDFWISLLAYMNTRCSHIHSMNFDFCLVMFGLSKNIITDSVMDLIILLAKYFVYKCKVNRTVPVLRQFKSMLFRRYVVEKEMSIMSNTLRKFEILWAPYDGLFRSLIH